MNHKSTPESGNRFLNLGQEYFSSFKRCLLWYTVADGQDG